MTRPNILVFFTDQQRWDTCGCYGQDLPVTPQLDAMAREGVLFRNAFTCQPVCGPARACIQTGRYATRANAPVNGISIDPSHRTIAQRLKAERYQTGYIGKWHLGSNHTHISSGLLKRPIEKNALLPVPPKYRKDYDYWLAADALEHTSHGIEGGYMYDGDGTKVEFGGYRVDRQTDFVIDYLDNHSGPDPFFLMVSYLEPHHQNDRDRYEGPAGEAQRWAHFTPPGDLRVKGGDWRMCWAEYLACINSLDRALGRVRETLKRNTMSDNTLILFTSDHGSHFRTRNQEYKRSCHDASTRIPFVACGPGFQGGIECARLASLVDLPATILAAAGADMDDIDGRPLQEAIDSSRGWRDAVFVQTSEHECGRSVRTSRWKYGVVSPDLEGWEQPGADRYVETYLYDLEHDPHELNNLVFSRALAPIRDELRRVLLQYIDQVENSSPVILTAHEAVEQECFPLVRSVLEAHLAAGMYSRK